MPRQKNSGLEIKCRGQYYYKTETAKGTRPYTLSIRAPSLELFRETASKYEGTDDDGKSKYKTSSFINIRGQLKRRYIPALLAKKYPDFARVKFVVIEEIVSHDGQPLNLPIPLRSRQQLAQYAREKDIPVNPNDYIEIDDLRTDILDYEQDPETFLRTKKTRDKKRSDERAFMEMNELNDEETPLAPLSTDAKNPSGNSGKKKATTVADL